MKTTIKIHSFETFENGIAKLNKKALKLGFAPISVKLIETRFLKLRNPSDPYELWGIENYLTVEEREYEIDSPELVLEGEWKLIAVFNLKENLVKVVPGESIGQDWKAIANKCDHCHIDRPRNDTFLIESGVTKERMVVGRTCLSDFLGVDPASFLQKIDFIGELLESISYNDDGPRTPIGTSLQWFLSFVIKIVRQTGFVSKKASLDTGREPTSITANFLSSLSSKRLQEMEIETPTEDDVKTAAMTIEWMKNINPTNDYLQNLKQIAENGFITSSSSGYAASAYSAMMKEQQEKAVSKTLSYIGTVGEKITIKAQLVHSSAYENQFGVSFFHKFVCEDGNIVLWSTNKEMNPNRWYNITAKVTDHKMFRNEPQTYITRPKITEA